MALYYACQAVLLKKRMKFISRDALSANGLTQAAMLRIITRSQVLTKELPTEELCRLTRVLLHSFSEPAVPPGSDHIQ